MSISETATVSISTETVKKATFQLKGGLFTLTALHLLNLDMEQLKTQLSDMVQQAPKFFEHAPIVVDVQKLAGENIDFSELLSILRQYRLIPVGIRHAGVAQRQMAAQAGLAILPDAKSGRNELPITEKKAVAASIEKATTTPTKLIAQNVRSGQQIYAQGGDLIIVGSVSPGAELLADGHIHIYGALRGRALAGVSGDTQARIFCHELAAELVSIAGHYWVNEDLQDVKPGQITQVFLQEDKLQLAQL